MITSAIGRIFLDAYNEEYGTSYDARTFFLEQFYPLFFDHNKYMMYVTNSPFVQQLPSFRDIVNGKKKKGTNEKITFENKTKREERLNTFLEKIKNNNADASIAVGYPSLDTTATTSGQVTDMQIKSSENDIFLSWIGGALGIIVKGGISILFSKKEILLDIYKGWKLYRNALNETYLLEGNKVNSWNGQWLSHYYDNREFEESNPWANFKPYISDKSGIISIGTQSWTKLLIGITRRYDNVQLMGYIYSIGQTNTTIGFIPFDLSGIRKPIRLYKKIFGDINSRNAESLWGTEYGFKTVCSAGVIGIKAMEPKGLKAYIENKKKPKTPKDEEETVNFNVYKIWILAMLNNEELWDKSIELAELLSKASVNKEKEKSTKPKNLVDNVLAATNKKQFVTAATDIATIVCDTSKFKEIVKEIHCMPTDNVPYFLTLVRFQYETIENN